MFNLAALFALYPRFYFIKSAYGNSEYRFLKWSGGGSPLNGLLNIALLVYRDVGEPPTLHWLQAEQRFQAAFGGGAMVGLRVARLGRGRE